MKTLIPNEDENKKLSELPPPLNNQQRTDLFLPSHNFAEIAITIITCSLCLSFYLIKVNAFAQVHGELSKTKPSATKFPPSIADIEYGKTEIRRMLKDRPQMRDLVQEGDPIWTMAARAFAGEYSGTRLKWISQEDFSHGWDAFHNWGTPTLEINVNGHKRDGTLIGPEECWRSLFFEIFNSSRFRENLKLREEALAGNCSRNEFIERSAELEYLAQLQTYRFYENSWKSRMAHRKAATPTTWYYIESTMPFEEWLSRKLFRNGPQGYPYGLFGNRYDQLRRSR